VFLEQKTEGKKEPRNDDGASEDVPAGLRPEKKKRIDERKRRGAVRGRKGRR